MPLLMLKELPRYECLLKAAEKYSGLDPSATAALLHLFRAGDEVFGLIDRNLSLHNLSQGGFGVLMLLLKSTDAGELPCGCNPGPHTPAELAEAAGVTRATMTGLIDTLERDGLVRRVPDPDDRRRMSVRLTAKAGKFLDRFLPSHFQLTASLMQPLSESERKTMVSLLNKLINHASGLMDAATASRKGHRKKHPLCHTNES
jgi:DNA-binding MarR family transcriptional regulator